MLAVICLVFAVSIYMGLCLRHRLISNHANAVSATADPMSAMREVLEPPKSSLSALLVSRAGSNQRLRRSFELTNTFVDKDPHLHRSFVTHARRLVQDQSSLRARTTLAEMSSGLVDDYLTSPSPTPTRQGHITHFDDLIQTVTFKVILCTLFHADLGTLNDGDVLFAARTINDLWQLSKQPTPPPPHLLATLNAHLRSWIPNYSNPLDFIIPTYETMWRVVAVTVALVHIHGTPALRNAFAHFLEKPSRYEFQHWALSGEPSIESVVHEAMRLHPPTRRISRIASLPRVTSISSPVTFLTSLFPSIHASAQSPMVANVVVVADVGCLQRDPSIWGPRCTEFEPARFHPSRLTDTQKECMLGFGYGRLKCIAKDWAPHTAAVIAAAVLAKCEGSGEQGYQIVEGPSIGGREGWQGWTVSTSRSA